MKNIICGLEIVQEIEIRRFYNLQLHHVSEYLQMDKGIHKHGRRCSETNDTKVTVMKYLRKVCYADASAFFVIG